MNQQAARSTLRSTVGILCAFTLLTPAVFSQTAWVSGPSFPTPSRTDCSGVVVCGALYALGGSPADVNGNGRCERNIIGSGTWTTLASFESLFLDTRAVVDGAGRFITIGGFDPSNGDQGADRIWDPIEGFAGDFPQRPEGAAFCGVAVTVDASGRIFAVGGSMEPGTTPVAAGHRYDATSNAWTTLAAMPVARADGAAAFDLAPIGGRVLVIGGRDGESNSRTGDVASFNPSTNSWSSDEYPDLPVATSNARAVRGVDGRVYVIGGRIGKADGTLTANVWRFDRATNAWQACPSLPTARERHGVALCIDDHICVLGGVEPTGPTSRVDRLLTVRCPDVTTTTGSTIAWTGGTASVSAVVAGTAPFEWQWFKDGVALSDGVQTDGSLVSGAQSAALVIEPVVAQTAGVYSASISNDCGTTLSGGHTVVVESAPPPPSANAWVATDLHPGWGPYSYAYGSVNGEVFGSASMPVQSWSNIFRPVVWLSGTTTALDLTSIGVGGEIYGGDGQTLVGWCWYPIMIQGQLWHYQYASKWTRGPSGGFTQASIHQGGYEYSVARDVEGSVIVGTGFTDSGFSHIPTAFTWTNGTWHTLGGSPYSHTSASCVDDGIPYGSGIATTGGTTNDVDAIRWVSATGGGAIVVDETGSIQDADGGIQVGSRDSMATMWAGTPESARSLHIAGAQTSEASGCNDGVQAGSIDGHAGVWFGGAQSWRDLHAALPAGFSSSHAFNVEVLADHTIVVTGIAYPSAGGSVHAMKWVAAPNAPTDLNGDGLVNAADLAMLLSQWGTNGAADLDHDGTVAASDLALLLAAWGA